jgi:hypothetical protein
MGLQAYIRTKDLCTIFQSSGLNFADIELEVLGF